VFESPRAHHSFSFIFNQVEPPSSQTTISEPGKTSSRKKNMDWAQYRDHDGRIRNEFGVDAFPTYLVIDPDGFVYKRIVGLNPQMSIVGQLKDTLKTILPE
jgi:hypothetical protein